jgi:hypothetical protein
MILTFGLESRSFSNMKAVLQRLKDRSDDALHIDVLYQVSLYLAVGLLHSLQDVPSSGDQAVRE